MSIYIAFALIAVVSYFVGTINFARIFSWYGRKKDITKLGSGNPGTMNMLRNFGFVWALLTLLAEVVKAGLCCYICKICLAGTGFEELAFFFSGLFVVLGSDFPVYFKFKGGKGVACLFGMFMFSQLWWVGLILFAVGIIMIIITEYGFPSSMVFILGMSIAFTVYALTTGMAYAWAIIAIVWFLAALTIFKHRGNILRFVKGEENKTNFKASVKKMFRHKKGVQEISEDQVESTPEKEIIVNDEKD